MAGIAILGCGRLGRMHAANVDAHPSTKLACVHDVHLPSATEMAEQFNVPVAENPQEIFSAADVDAVLAEAACKSLAEKRVVRVEEIG